MIDGLLHEYELWRLQRSKRKIGKIYAKTLNKAREQKQGRDKIGEINSEEMFEIDLVDDKIAHIHSWYLLDKLRGYSS